MAKPLILVTTLARKDRKLVRADSIEFVKAAAISKFGLDAGRDYKCIVDNDGMDSGVDVDEDDVLEALASSYAAPDTRLNLCVIGTDEVWTRPHQTGTVDVVASLGNVHSMPGVIRSADGDTIVLDLEPEPCSSRSLTMTHTSGRSHILEMGPIEAILDKALAEVKKDVQPTNILSIKNSAALEVAQIIARHLVNVEEYSLPVATGYCKAVMDYRARKYASVFERTVGGAAVSDGLPWFSSKVYNAINYKKGKIGKRKARPEREVSEEGVEQPAPTKKVRRRRRAGDHCCPNYRPLLPAEETPETMESKRLLLVKCAEDKRFDEECRSLMMQSYPAQRQDILATQPMNLLGTVFLGKWPCFSEGQFLLWHASILCKPTDQLTWDCEAVFEKNYSQRTPDIISCMKFVWEKELSLKRPSRRTAHASNMIDLIAKAEAQQVAGRTSMAKSIIVLPNVCAYMRENFEFVLVVVEADASEETILNAVEPANENPVIVVKGADILDTNAQVEIRIFNTMAIKAADVVQAYLIWYMCFFVFDFCYTKEVQSTLEFMQRFFLCMTEESGCRRENPKRNVDAVDSHVVDLANTLKNFNSPWNV